MRFRSIATMVPAIWLSGACGESVAPIDVGPGDPQLGRVAFTDSCAECHASGDGFDLAFFGFSGDDIIRRAMGHVDTTTAHHILAYVESLAVSPAGRNHVAFQPGTDVASGDERFWLDLTGAAIWPDAWTVDTIAALELRDLNIPLQLPLWSVEANDSDWMPDEPLADEILAADDNVVDAGLRRYVDGPTLANLELLLADFDRVTRDSAVTPDPICAGGAASHVHPVPCFEARRWMSSLAALHFIRGGNERDLNEASARLFWAVGEAAVSVRFLANRSSDPIAIRNVARWLTLGFVYAPHVFPEHDSYLQQHLATTFHPRLATLFALKRFTTADSLHAAIPSQIYWDGVHATTASPDDMVADVSRLVYGHLADRHEQGIMPTGADRDRVLTFLDFSLVRLGMRDLPAEVFDELNALHQAIVEDLTPES